VILLLSLTVMGIMSQEDDNRNKAVEAAGTAVAGAGLLGGLLFGGGLVAKAIGDAAKGHSARSNGDNIVRHVPSGPASNDYEGECDYDCNGWPYQECKVTKKFKYGGWKSATCISPYSSRSSYRMYSNYPECARLSTVYKSECDRCDDVCSARDGHDKYDYTETGPQYPEYPVPITGYQYPAPLPTPPHSPPSPNPEDCSEIKGRRVCCSDYGECSGYTGPDPTPWQREQFTSCEYSDGHLHCDFSNDCSKMNNGRMVCCEDGGDCSAYEGPNPRDPLCYFHSDGAESCA